MQLQDSDSATLARKGKTEERVLEELRMLREGFPMLRIEAPATVGNGIVRPTIGMQETSARIWDDYLAAGAKVVKMVPASGAASRMFKNLFSFLNGKSDTPKDDFMREFFDNIEKFAFFPRLNYMTIVLHQKSVGSLIAEKRYKDIVGALILHEGMNYGQLPKALLEFHKVSGTSRTALEEHLAESAEYAAGKNGEVNVHFTVSSEHMPLVGVKVEETKRVLENATGRRFNVSYSVQKPSTDTVAALPDGTPYRENGELFFRPGGHGALIENLNDIDADVIFIKNIDNVVPDALREPTVRSKKVLGGTLVGVKQQIDGYCRKLERSECTPQERAEMLDFLHRVLCVTHDTADEMTPEEQRRYLMSKFNRPTRVCGMVKNEGEPGGGPFLAYNPDGTVSPQILEMSQIDSKDAKIKKMLKGASHFNPVDLVCSIRDYKGRKFNLPDYVDPATGFISEKSREGVEIKALELPGLWNGAMSDWNTIFIEVDAATFNPVKTVNDLLRPAHQNG